MNFREARRKILRAEDQTDLDLVAQRIASNGFCEEERSELRGVWQQRKTDLANGETVELRTRCRQIADHLLNVARLTPGDFLRELKLAVSKVEEMPND